jgi:hypothetical protein
MWGELGVIASLLPSYLQLGKKEKPKKHPINNINKARYYRNEWRFKE